MKSGSKSAGLSTTGLLVIQRYPLYCGRCYNILNSQKLFSSRSQACVPDFFSDRYRNCTWRTFFLKFTQQVSKSSQFCPNHTCHRCLSAILIQILKIPYLLAAIPSEMLNSGTISIQRDLSKSILYTTFRLIFLFLARSPITTPLTITGYLQEKPSIFSWYSRL